MESRQARFELSDGYSISRIIKGGWQLAGGHGRIDTRQAMIDMRDFVMAGITTFDCADIYTGVEELIGRFLSEHRTRIAAGEMPPVQVHTKYVPDLDTLSTVTRAETGRTIDRSLQRLGVERLDLVQFHWWDYSIPRYVEVCSHLAELQQQGKIRHIGVTNFDTPRLKDLLDAGCPVVSNQVQYSVLDQRPAGEMRTFLKQHGLALLCYGTVAGGFLSDSYLGAEARDYDENRSLVKYRLIIEEMGGFGAFQDLLKVLRTVADNHAVGIAEIAAGYVLQQANVAGVIIGARNTQHLAGLGKLAGLTLSDEEMARIQAVIDSCPGVPGDVYELERDRDGRHGRIMKYNLNEQDAS